MDEEERNSTKSNIPEDILNLELKFLDENVRPYITHVVESWVTYMKTGTGGNIIVIYIQALLWQLRPVQRLTEIELERFENRNKELLLKLKEKNNGTFNRDIIQLINDLNDKIGDCKLFARPTEETTSGLGMLMQQMKKAEKEEKEKEKKV